MMESLVTESVVSENRATLLSVARDPGLLAPILLIGASALIPLPFVDDLLRGRLERHLFRLLGEREGLDLRPSIVEAMLTRESKVSKMRSMLGKALLYPIRRGVRKVLYFLEVKRAVDQTAEALARAWLFRTALRRGWWTPEMETDRLREAIQAACRSQGIRPLEGAISGAFHGTRRRLIGLARRTLGLNPDQPQEWQEVVAESGLPTRLLSSINGLSDAYLNRFAEQFEGHLQSKKPTPQD